MLSVQLIGLALATVAVAVDVTKNPALVASLTTSAQRLDRLAQLPHDSDWLFDFEAQTSYNFAPGSVVNANAATWPATVDNELTMAIINLGPCSMLPPHFHPRASNYVVSISGNTTTYMIEENGARVVTQNLTPMKMTIFPRASIHTMINNDCTNSQLVSALSSTDTGTSNLVNGLSALPQNVLEAAFGGAGQVPSFNKVPDVGAGAIYGTKECRKACGLN